ncbi:MAG: hypothetical protein AB1938_06205 [Myxococcota bacterium]
MRTHLLKALTLVVALGFVIGATVAAGSDKSRKTNAKPTPEAKADAGAKPATPTFLPATKAAMPMHFEEPAPSPAQAQQPQKPKPAAQPAPQPQAAPTQQATP